MKSWTAGRGTVALLIALACVALVIFLLPDGRQRATGPTPDVGSVDLTNEIEQFARGLSPNSGYQAPTTAQRQAFAEGVGRLLDGDQDGASDVLGKLGYRIRRGVDTATARGFAEAYDGNPAVRGWGRVLVDGGTKPRLGIEIPHAKTDMGSETMGMELYRKVPGGVLVITGSNRHARADGDADMAHATDSVFESVHELLKARSLPVMQLHGFADDSAPGTDVIISAGPGFRSDFVERVAQRVSDAGLEVCRPWVTRCRGLEAVTNAQAAHGGEFVHIEVSRTVRDSDEQRGTLVTALAGEVSGR